MIQKFAASDDLKFFQVEVISKCIYAHAPYYFMLVIFVLLTI